MNRPLQLALALAPLAALPATAQVVRIGGGASTASDTQGAGVTVYQADATTQSSVGYAQGVHLGVSRMVQNSAGALTVGDSYVRLDLPTDLPGGGRTMNVRGALLQTLDERNGSFASASMRASLSQSSSRFGGSVFTGWTGDGYNNAFFSSVQTTHSISVGEGHFTLSPAMQISAFAVRGTHSSVLASAAWKLQPATLVAFSAGLSGGHPVAIASAQTQHATWTAAITYTSRALHLQPEPTLATLNLERIGWNLNVTKRVRNHVWLDFARQEYATADALDSSEVGVTAGRSTLYEGGATVRFWHAEAGARMLRSVSGAQTSGGIVMIAGWTERRWDVHATAVQSTGVDGAVSSSTTIDTTERVNTHLHLTQGVTFANGAPSYDFGGSYENRFGAITVSHRETFVPFGNQTGFHRVLAIGIRLHVRDTEFVANQVSAPGLATVYDVAVDSYRGDSLGVPGGGPSHISAMPRYAVRGRVLNVTGEPIRGAAVAAGSQTVYTDSEGRFFARFSHATTVRVAVEPIAFLTAENYRSAGAPGLLVEPRYEDAAEDIELKVERCTVCGEDVPLNTRMDVEDREYASVGSIAKKYSTIRRVSTGLYGLGKRMVQLKPSRSRSAS